MRDSCPGWEGGGNREAPLHRILRRARRRNEPGGKRVGKNVPGGERHVKRPCGQERHRYVESL